MNVDLLHVLLEAQLSLSGSDQLLLSNKLSELQPR